MTIRIEDLQREGMKQGMLKFSAGQTVRVHRMIREGDKERIQSFEGLVIEVKNQGSLAASVTVRKIVGGIGVEQVFMVHSPLIEKIELIKEAKVRRSKLYFMRDLRGKAARLKERYFTDADMRAMKQDALDRDEKFDAELAGTEQQSANETLSSEPEEPAAVQAVQPEHVDEVAVETENEDNKTNIEQKV